MFLGNYSYGIYKLNISKYDFEKNLFIKIISPNFSLKDYQNHTEEFQLKRLIKISDPENEKKTLFIWPEGIFYESYLEEIKRHRKLFENNFSENHLIVLGINNFNNLNKIEEVADDILNVLSKCGLKYYNELKEGFNENRN